jgi:predicted transcriptional regulator
MKTKTKICMFISTILLTSASYAKQDYKLDFHKSLISDEVDVVNSKAYKGIKNTNYKQIINNHLIDKKIAEHTLNFESLDDLATTCYMLSTDNDIFIKNLDESKHCLNILSKSGVDIASEYKAIRYFDKYKNILIKDKKVSIEDLVNASIWFGISEGMSDIVIDSGDSKLSSEGKINFDQMLGSKFMKLKNKDVLKSYYNYGLMFSTEYPLNNLFGKKIKVDDYQKAEVKYTQDQKSEESKLKFDLLSKKKYKELINIYKDENKGNMLATKLLETIDHKNPKTLNLLFNNVMYGKNGLIQDSETAEFGLFILSIKDKNSESSYKLGLYKYALATSAKDILPDDKLVYFNSALSSLAIAQESGYDNAYIVVKNIFAHYKSDKRQLGQIIKKYNRYRKNAKLLLSNKIK